MAVYQLRHRYLAGPIPHGHLTLIWVCFDFEVELLGNLSESRTQLQSLPCQTLSHSPSIRRCYGNHGFFYQSHLILGKPILIDHLNTTTLL